MPDKDDIRIPYRCQHCYAVLVRQRPTAELAAIEERRGYICNECGERMTAKQVDSGEFDIQMELSTCEVLHGSGPHEFCDVINYLRNTHQSGYVYRGQTNTWSGPLVPSLYRGRVEERPLQPPPKMRLRELGKVFHAVSTDIAESTDKLFERRISFNAHLHQIFGYPFGSMLAQQCGVTSEGLDVSHDPEVAAFFAIFDYARRCFPRDGIGVIYRIPVPDDQTGNKDLRTASFYDCPSVVSSLVVFMQLRRTATWKEALNSFVEYGQSAMTRELPRPLHLLAVPEDEVGLCRVVQQRAGLLFPDVVLPSEYYQLRRKPPPGKADWNGPLLVEDVKSREGVETFVFRHDPRNQYCLTQAPNTLFPKVDAVTKLLKTYFTVNPTLITLTELGVMGGGDIDLIM